MQGILYVFHGSRIPEAIDANVSFFQLVKEQIEVPLQEMCFLELAEPDISQGIERLVNQGGGKHINCSGSPFECGPLLQRHSRKNN